MDSERIYSDAPLAAMWARLGVLESPSAARRFLEERAARTGKALSAAAAERKALGLAYCIRTAREYFAVQPTDLSLAGVSYYYGALALLEALLLVNGSEHVGLAEVEEFTKQGHGLKVVADDSGGFPDGERLALLSNGFAVEFLKQQGVATGSVAVSKGPRKWSEMSVDDRDRCVTAMDLFARIPELRPFFVEIFQRQPEYLSARIPSNPAWTEAEVEAPWYQNSTHLTPAIASTILDLDSSTVWVAEGDGLRTQDKLPLAPLNALPTYESVMAVECVVRSLMRTRDVLIFQFMLLYMTSIWVRYRPSTWRELMEGKHDACRPLVSIFLMSVQRVLPNTVLDRLYDRRILITPQTYWG